jgi:hypothetical protein
MDDSRLRLRFLANSPHRPGGKIRLCSHLRLHLVLAIVIGDWQRRTGRCHLAIRLRLLSSAAGGAAMLL